MSAPPIPCRWEGDCFRPLPGFARTADRHYVVGEVSPLAPVLERSEVSHRQEFAWLREAWQSLPEHLSDEYPTAEHLRKRMLIKTGWCTTTDYICATRAETLRWADYLRRELDEYAVVIVRDGIVRVHRARSQSRTAMNKEDFQASKTAILEAVSDLLGVAPATLERQRESA